jgi:hypothetical protein
MGEEATRPRSERVKIDVEKRIVLNVQFYLGTAENIGDIEKRV